MNLKTILDFVKNIFSKKSPPVEAPKKNNPEHFIIQEEENEELNKEIERIMRGELHFEEPKPKLEVYESPKSPKQNLEFYKPKKKPEFVPTAVVKESENGYKQLIENLEKPEIREQVIKEKQEREFKVLDRNDKEDLIATTFEKLTFFFDKEGFEIFNEDFNVKGYSLCLVHSQNGEYLARVNKETEREDLFHRFFMKDEIEDFYSKKDVEYKNIVVHHVNFSEKDNRKLNLQVMTKEEHDILHNRTTI